MFAIWMWADSVLATGAEKAFDDCQLVGITDVFYLTKGLSGRCAFLSEKVPPMAEGRDLLAEAIHAAHARNIRLHAWFTSAQDADYCASHPNSGLFHFRNGYSEKTVNIADDAYARHLHGLLTEMLQKYDVDGVHLDYLRYNHLLYSWSEADKARYRQLGIDVEHVCELMERTFYAEPQTQIIFDRFRSGDENVCTLANARIQTVNRFADEVLDGIKSERPNICLSAALMPEGAYDFAFAHLHYGQSYRDLGQRFDFIVPMAYSIAYGKDESWVKTVAQGALNFSPAVMAGLHAYEGSTGLTLAKDADAAKSVNGTDGICLFRYGTSLLASSAKDMLCITNPMSEAITRIELSDEKQKRNLEISIPPCGKATLPLPSSAFALRAWSGEKEVCAYLSKGFPNT